MSNPPSEITTPPFGYEWTGEVRFVNCGEWYGHWSANEWLAFKADARVAEIAPILRRAKPPTVTVELPRTQVEYGARPDNVLASWYRDACREALARENAE